MARRTLRAGVRALLHRHLRDAGQQLAVLRERAHDRRRRRSPDARRARASARRARGRRDRAARRATSRAATPRRRPPRARSAPAIRSVGRPAPERSRHAVGVDAGDDRRRCAPRRRAARARCAPPRAAARETAPSTYGLPSTSTMRADSGRMLRKSWRSDCRAISASAPASSTPVGPPPTITKVSSRRCASGIGLALGRLERQQHPPPDLQRIVERLQARRARRPLGMAEVRVRGAGRDDQVVVRIDASPPSSRRSRAGRRVDRRAPRRAAPATFF